MPKASPNHRWLHPLAKFLSGQLGTQFITAVTGLLILHWLPVEEYAEFGLTFAFQSFIAMLADTGFSSSIVGLVGERHEEPGVISSYIRSARFYRNRAYVLVMAGAAATYPIIMRHHHWSLRTIVLLFSSLAAFIYFQGWYMYSTPLLLRRRVGTLYKARAAGCLIRLAVVLVLHLAHSLSAVTASWAGVLGVALNGWMYLRYARPLVGRATLTLKEANANMKRVVGPQIPSIVFWGLQSQIVIGVIAVFGSSRSIAEVSALGRLGQLFMLIAAANTVLIEPYMARLRSPDVSRRYWQIGAMCLALATALTLSALAFPRPLTLLLGREYDSVTSDIGWTVAGASAAWIANVVWVMNVARRFVYWWGTALQILTVLVAQGICVILLDVSTTHGAVLFSLITSVANIAVPLGCGLFGLTKLKVSEPSRSVDIAAETALAG